MAGKKKTKRRKTVKGRKTAKRVAKKTVVKQHLVLKLPTDLGKVVAASVVEGMSRVLDKVVSDTVARIPSPAAQMLAPIQEPSKTEPRLAHVGADQRYTKNIGNYESFVFGFSLNIPVEIDALDNIENPETRAKLRPKYEATMGFLNDMLKEVGKEVDTARGLVTH